MTVDIERVAFDQVMVYAQTRLPRGVQGVDCDVRFDLAADQLVATLTGYVLGQEGQSVTASTVVDVPRFPRWLPKWLRRRWTGRQTVSLDATPVLVWPEAQWTPPEWGRYVEIVRPGSISAFDDPPLTFPRRTAE